MEGDVIGYEGAKPVFALWGVPQNLALHIYMGGGGHSLRPTQAANIVHFAETVFMTRTDQEYRIMLDRIRESQEAISLTRQHMVRENLPQEEIDFSLAPMQTYHQSLQEEAERYEHIKCGNLQEINSLSDIGQLLIALRIQKPWTQKELADRLGVSPAQVCRDEKNEYFGMSVESA